MSDEQKLIDALRETGHESAEDAVNDVIDKRLKFEFDAENKRSLLYSGPGERPIKVDYGIFNGRGWPKRAAEAILFESEEGTVDSPPLAFPEEWDLKPDDDPDELEGFLMEIQGCPDPDESVPYLMQIDTDRPPTNKIMLSFGTDEDAAAFKNWLMRDGWRRFEQHEGRDWQPDFWRGGIIRVK